MDWRFVYRGEILFEADLTRSTESQNSASVKRNVGLLLRSRAIVLLTNIWFPMIEPCSIGNEQICILILANPQSKESISRAG